MYPIGLSTPCCHITEENLASYRTAGMTVIEISDGIQGFAGVLNLCQPGCFQ